MCYKINNFNWMAILFTLTLFMSHFDFAQCDARCQSRPVRVTPNVILSLSKDDNTSNSHNSIIRRGGQCNISILLYSVFQGLPLGIFYSYAIRDCITISYLFIFLLAVITYISLLTNLGKNIFYQLNIVLKIS